MAWPALPRCDAWRDTGDAHTHTQVPGKLAAVCGPPSRNAKTGAAAQRPRLGDAAAATPDGRAPSRDARPPPPRRHGGRRSAALVPSMDSDGAVALAPQAHALRVSRDSETERPSGRRVPGAHEASSTAGRHASVRRDPRAAARQQRIVDRAAATYAPGTHRPALPRPLSDARRHTEPGSTRVVQRDPCRGDQRPGAPHPDTSVGGVRWVLPGALGRELASAAPGGPAARRPAHGRSSAGSAMTPARAARWRTQAVVVAAA
jgi:hypothetical protein